jgi:sulfur carrier protein
MKKKEIINFTLNGKCYKIYCFKKLTIHHLLIFFNYNFNLIVIEYNGKILQKSFYQTTYLDNNNNIEIITIVGGG